MTRLRGKRVASLAAVLLLAQTGSAYARDPGDAARPIVFSAIPEGRRGGAHCQNGGDTEVFTVGPDTGRVRRVTRNRRYDNFPSWAPGGRRIVVSSRPPAGDDQDLVVMRLDGGRRRLTRGRANDFYPRWSPGGQWIAFTRVFPRLRDAEGQEKRSLMAIRPDGSRLRRLTKPRVHHGELTANWGPEGRRIVFTADGRPRVSTNLLVMGRRGRNVRQLTHVDYAEYSLPDWSPDRRWITYSSYGDYEDEVQRVRADGRGRARLSPSDLIDPHFSVWGPGGGRIAFVASRSGCQPDVFVMSERRRVRNLLKDRDLEVYSLDW